LGGGGGRILNAEFGRDLEISGCGLIEVLSQHLLGGTEENYEADVQSEIRTKHRSNTDLESYHCINMFDKGNMCPSMGPNTARDHSLLVPLLPSASYVYVA
jgi:hypothetical protein